MSEIETDLRFFTNSDSDSLYDRFSKTLKDAEFFDVLVGYFRISGFNIMYKQLEDVEKIRILIGLNVDRKGFELIERSNEQLKSNFHSHENCRKEYQEILRSETDNSEDSSEFEIAANKFMEFITCKKLELRVHPSRNLHAKVYITRFKKEDRDFGRVITGSSNFSEKGLVAQREFNVELKDRPDVDFALNRFEELWKEGVDVSQEYVETIKEETWLLPREPYEIYLKFLYEYFQEEINLDKVDLSVPDGFMTLEYQKQAVVSAKGILERYNGVFLADVVGLGKTYITSLLLQQLEGGKLILCPPVLKEYWEDTLRDFNVVGYKVESIGKVNTLLKSNIDKYQYIVVDEAHRFRNQMTGGYEDLHRICLNKKIVLVSATPLNNKLEDLNAQIKLFQPGKNSNIPNTPNLDEFFKKQQKMIDKHDKGSLERLSETKITAENVRQRILSHIMLRRTRSEIVDIYGEDIKKQGVFFPKIAKPEKIIYQFDEATETVFNETIKLLKRLSYARYTPLLYLKERLGGVEEQAQRNLSGFMRGILVKRLESSFFAFGKTLGRFISSHKNFIEMYAKGTVWISKKVDVFELLYQDNEDRLEELLKENKAENYLSDKFVPEYQTALEKDFEVLESIKGLWKKINRDPKIEKFIDELKQNKILVNKKVLIFSESKETANYIQFKLDEQFPNRVLSYSSQGGVYQKKSHTHVTLRKVIEENYDPNNENQKDDVQILITTDVLAEGINLHRANIIINYDLPWNPTRVLQRVGRVNRIGTKHDKIHIFNFFPTAQADKHLGLENNIKGKLQAFHSVMGEDAQYLSEDEEVSAHGLFEKLNSAERHENEGPANSESIYLKEIRKIRDDSPELFEKIKNLPKKARTGRMLEGDLAMWESRVLTFFRKGVLREFVISDEISSEELHFENAVELFKCSPNTKGKKFSSELYHKLLQMNKDHLDKLKKEDEKIATGGGRSNETQLLNTLKAVQNEKQYTENEENYIKKASKALEQGAIPRQTVKKIIKAIKKDVSPFHVLNQLRDCILPAYLQIEEANASSSQARKVVLSSYLIGAKNERK